ncbi:hypothetical protein EP56_15165 [Listeriaceae bacterium FSL A5-0209]|nr:hypothetical protein EP56_15165 [Listeriaceae bacterium FSL A5-0209]
MTKRYLKKQPRTIASSTERLVEQTQIPFSELSSTYQREEIERLKASCKELIFRTFEQEFENLVKAQNSSMLIALVASLDQGMGIKLSP